MLGRTEMTELSYEEVNKTITQQMTEYFDYDIDKAIEEQKENFPNPDKLSYDDWKELNEEKQKLSYDDWKSISKSSHNDFYTFLKSRYLMYLKK